MKKISLYLCILLAVNAANSQSVGIGTNNPSGKFHITNNPSGSDALFFVDTTGNVGIGTLGPQNKLDVNGGITSQSARIITSSANTIPLRIQHIVTSIDQQQNTGDFVYQDINAGWQSFTAGITGNLERVTISFHNTHVLGGFARIYSGEGTGDTLLASITYAPSVSGGSVSLANLNVHVIAGNKYTIWLNTRFGWLYTGSDVYSGGRGENTSIDRRFKTYVYGAVDRLQVDNSGNIGIGTDSAFEKLVVKTGRDNYGVMHTDGTISFGTFVGGSSVNGGWIGTQSNHPLLFFTNNGSSQMVLLQNGNVGIGTVSPVYKLQVSGLIAANDFVSTSDARLKKDIVPLRDALSKVIQLNGVTYYWKGESYPQYQFDTKHKIGFLAQEVEKIMPELVATGTDGYKTVNYIEVVPLLVESIKEQQHRIDQQLEIIESLKVRLDKLEKTPADKK